MTRISMVLEHFHLQASPFREEIDPGNFYPGGGREEVVEKLVGELTGGHLLVKLIGAEGSGKSLLCRVVADRLQESAEVVLLDDPVGSFSELLRILCLDLGLAPDLEEDALIPGLREAIDRCRQEGRRVVVILDNAERIFLATLERLLKFLCEVEEEGGLSVLLSGRPALETNLEQLTLYCTGVELSAGYTLPPFDRAQTGEYLASRLKAAGLAEERREEIFSAEAVDKIHAASSGNPRMINILAEEALEKSCSDKSFMVLLEHVGAEQPGGEDRGRVLPGAGDLGRRLLRPRVYLGAGAVLLVLLLALFFFRDRGNPNSPAIPRDEGAGLAGRPAADGTPVRTAAGSKASVAARREVPAKVSEHAEDAGPAKAAGLATRTTVEPEQKKEERRPVAEQRRDGERLFEERLRASATWLAGAYRGEYTVQLMMLSSDQAARRIKELLVKDEYYAIRDKLHILRKQTTPPTLFVFYGTFPTMDAARQARNQMPVFLRRHHPYALSIADALTKTED